jgi:hypothetical protein
VFQNLIKTFWVILIVLSFSYDKIFLSFIFIMETKTKQFWHRIKDRKFIKSIITRTRRLHERYLKMLGKFQKIDKGVLVFVHEAELSVALVAMMVGLSWGGYLLFSEVETDDVVMQGDVMMEKVDNAGVGRRKSSVDNAGVGRRKSSVDNAGVGRRKSSVDNAGVGRRRKSNVDNAGVGRRKSSVNNAGVGRRRKSSVDNAGVGRRKSSVNNAGVGRRL